MSKIKDQIFSGEIAEQLTDEKEIAPVEVSQNTVHKGIGRNISGQLWKKVGGVKSDSRNVSKARKTWAQKVAFREKEKSLKKRMAEVREEKDAATRDMRRKIRENKDRRKVNEMKSAKYQIIKNLSNTKKWHKKAKRSLSQLPAEIFYQKFKC